MAILLILDMDYITYTAISYNWFYLLMAFLITVNKKYVMLH